MSHINNTTCCAARVPPYQQHHLLCREGGTLAAQQVVLLIWDTVQSAFKEARMQGVPARVAMLQGHRAPRDWPRKWSRFMARPACRPEKESAGVGVPPHPSRARRNPNAGRFLFRPTCRACQKGSMSEATPDRGAWCPCSMHPCTRAGVEEVRVHPVEGHYASRHFHQAQLPASRSRKGSGFDWQDVVPREGGARNSLVPRHELEPPRCQLPRARGRRCHALPELRVVPPAGVGVRVPPPRPRARWIWHRSSRCEAGTAQTCKAMGTKRGRSTPHTGQQRRRSHGGSRVQRRRSGRILAPHTALGAQWTGCPGSPSPRSWTCALQAFRLSYPYWICPFWIRIGHAQSESKMGKSNKDS